MPGFVDRVEVDLISGGQGTTPMSQDIVNGRYTLEPKVGFDPGILRPVIQTDGRKYCKIKTGRMLRNKQGSEEAESRYIPLQRLINSGMLPFTYNASALPYQTWQRIDRAVITAARDRLNAWNDLAAANTYGGFDGMSVTALIRDTMRDVGDAKVDLDTLSDDFADTPTFQPDILPLPIIHAGTSLSERRLAVSRNSGVPLDTTMIEQCGRRCAETLEKMTIGVIDYSTTVIGSTTDFTNRGIYGFLTQPNNLGSVPTGPASFVAATLLSDVLAMIEAARAQKFYGPFVLYYGTAWDQYMARDYWVYQTSGGAAPTMTMLQRLQLINSISRVAMLDLLTGTDYEDRLILVQFGGGTVRAVDGMDWTPVQWVKDGGAQIMLRVMGIKVPDLRSQYIGTGSDRYCGIVDGDPA